MVDGLSHDRSRFGSRRRFDLRWGFLGQPGQHPLDLLATLGRDQVRIYLGQVELELLPRLVTLTQIQVASAQVEAKLRVGRELEGPVDLAKRLGVIARCQGLSPHVQVSPSLSPARLGLQIGELFGRGQSGPEK